MIRNLHGGTDRSLTNLFKGLHNALSSQMYFQVKDCSWKSWRNVDTLTKMKWIILFWICSCATDIKGGPLNQIDETGTTFPLIVSDDSFSTFSIEDTKGKS